MKVPFLRESEAVRVQLSRRERAVLAELPRLLASVTPGDPAAARLKQAGRVRIDGVLEPESAAEAERRLRQHSDWKVSTTTLPR